MVVVVVDRIDNLVSVHGIDYIYILSYTYVYTVTCTNTTTTTHIPPDGYVYIHTGFGGYRELVLYVVIRKKKPPLPPSLAHSLLKKKATTDY